MKIPLEKHVFLSGLGQKWPGNNGTGHFEIRHKMEICIDVICQGLVLIYRQGRKPFNSIRA